MEKEVFKTRKTLAGYSMRKDIKHEIVFQKEVIIIKLRTLLQPTQPSCRNAPHQFLRVSPRVSAASTTT